MKKGVLLLQMGGPCCLGKIEEFLFNLFNDPYIIQLPKFLKPYQKYLAEFIARRRAPKVTINYKEIGGGSPILKETQEQAYALEQRLNQDTKDEYKCFVAMRYSFPFLKDTYKLLLDEELETLDVIPLYPQYSVATTASSFYECNDMFRDTGYKKKVDIKYIRSWEDDPCFIELIKNRIEEKLSSYDLTKGKINLLFSAHGLPQSYVDKGDPYEKQINRSVTEIVNKLKKTELENIKWQITFQSRVGPVKWLEPNTEDVLKELGQAGEKNVLIVPISFVGDHIETLHELGIEYKELAKEFGIENYQITRLPKSDPLLIEALANCIKKISKLREDKKEKILV